MIALIRVRKKSAGERVGDEARRELTEPETLVTQADSDIANLTQLPRPPLDSNESRINSSLGASQLQ